MNKLILFLTLLFLSTNHLSAQLSTNGLVAHWSFNGNAMDVSGNGHHGSINNISYTNGANNTSNSAAVFNGSSSFVSVPYDNDFNVTKFSIVSVFRVNDFYTSTCQGNFILQRGDKWKNGSYGLHFTDNYYDNDCAVTGDTSNFYLGFDAGPGNSSIPNTSWQTTDTVRTGRWYCVVATYDSSKLRVYVNGQLSTTVTSVNGPLDVGTSLDSISIGANRFGNYAQFPYFFNGVIDDIMLYNRALSSSEVSLYCNGTTDINSPALSNNTTTDNFECYPNPTSGIILLKGTVSIDDVYNITVLNVLGQKVYTGTVTSQQGTVSKSINLSGVPSGTYMMHISSDKGESVMRVVVE